MEKSNNFINELPKNKEYTSSNYDLFLLIKFREDDMESFGILYKKYRYRCVKAALSGLKNKCIHTAEDVVEKLWFEMFSNKFHRFDETRGVRFESWIVSCTYIQAWHENEKQKKS